MIIIFLTMAHIADIEVSGIYEDLLRKFWSEGHEVFIVSPSERRLGLKTNLQERGYVHFLSVRTLNLQKTSVIEKGLGQVLVDSQYKKAIKRFFRDVRFDLIFYSTPPITFPKVIDFLRRQNPSAKTYLLLKDIFPQNAVDLGMMNKRGVKGVLYRFFRRKEKRLYALSDFIGCMSPANVSYLLDHNQEIPTEHVEVAPNSVALKPGLPLSEESAKCRMDVRKKFHLPVEKPVFIYGGNLGKPQGIPFLIECFEANGNRDDCHFVVIGTGTEWPKLNAWYEANHPKSVTVLKGLPKAEYDELVGACDVGMIFLDHRFTIPNFPSRLLSYLENKMPVICATDPNTDMGRIAEENGFGFWCESNSVEAFNEMLDKMIRSDRKTMGVKGYEFLKENYTVEKTYEAIMRHF